MCAYTIPMEVTDLDYPGGFRPGRRVKWWMTTMAPDLRRRHGLPPPHTPAEARVIWDEIERGKWLWLVPWLDLPRHLPPGLAEYVEDWLRHPTRRPWRFAENHGEVSVPNLDISGWYDHCNSSMGHLAGMQAHAHTEEARTQSKLVAGPWNHVGLGQRLVSGIDFGPQAQVDLPGLIVRWFDHWLKGLDNGVAREPPVRYFVMGSGRWKSADRWPPAGLDEVVYYMGSDGDANQIDGSGCLSAELPGQEPDDTYRYDPQDPVPTLWTPELFTGPADRRALAHRQDILRYRSPPLEQEVEVVGHPEVVLYASSTARDTDFFARLVDEDPAGPALEVCYGMVRARHRRSLEQQELLVPGQVTEFRIRLGPTACRFRRGHRIWLEITSSDYPNHDRNHNTGGDDLSETEMVVARQRVFHTGEHPSRLILRTEDVSG